MHQSQAAFVLALVLALSFNSCGGQPQQFKLDESAAFNAAGESARLDINTAGVDELERLPGIGKVLATRVVEHREKHGPFRRTEHLMMVRGISDRKFRELSSLVIAR